MILGAGIAGLVSAYELQQAGYRVTVLDHGQKIAEGTPEEIRNNVTVMHTYLGITS